MRIYPNEPFPLYFYSNNSLIRNLKPYQDYLPFTYNLTTYLPLLHEYLETFSEKSIEKIKSNKHLSKILKTFNRAFQFPLFDELPNQDEIWNFAAKYNHNSLIQYLHADNEILPTKRAMDLAARYGHLELVKFLHKNRSESCSTDAADYAAARGHTKVFEFLYLNHLPYTNCAFRWAVKNEHEDMIRYLTILNWLNATTEAAISDNPTLNNCYF